MSLQPPQQLVKLRTALHAKAKASPGYRFYALYDKLYRWDVLDHAYERCKANQGAAGVDDQTFQDIEAYGARRWLEELAQEIQEKTYQPQPVRRVWIPKPDGKQRPLGIPTIRDRVVQMAAVLVLEPIFEADLQPEQHAYRPGKSGIEAVQAVTELLDRGYTDGVDADWSGYFDHLAKVWIVIAGAALAGRTIQLFFIRDIQTGLVWFTKILTDPFNDVKQYWRSPLYLMKGELVEPAHGRPA